MALNRCTADLRAFPVTVEVTEQQQEMIKAYHQLLVKWSDKISMIADSLDWEAFWQRHVLDSIQLIPLLRAYGMPVADLGSGAGLPGIILAILGINDLCLIERNGKKAAFLATVAAELGLSVEIFADDVIALHKKYRTIVSRAVADISTILKITKNIRDKDSVILLLKSNRQLLAELPEALKTWSFQTEQYQSVSSNQGSLLELTDIKEGICL